MLTKDDVAADMPQMRFARFYQKLITEIQELEERVEARMHPAGHLRGPTGSVGGPPDGALSLNGWMYLINKAMDKRAALIKQLEYLSGGYEMNWAKLWERLNAELPSA